MDSLTSALSSMPNVDALDLRIKSMELMIQHLTAQPRDGTFNVATPLVNSAGPVAASPLTASPPLNVPMMPDPWLEAASRLPGSQLPGRMAPTALNTSAEYRPDFNLLDMPVQEQSGTGARHEPMQAPAVPSGFEGYGKPSQSQIAIRPCGFRARDARSSPHWFRKRRRSQRTSSPRTAWRSTRHFGMGRWQEMLV